MLGQSRLAESIIPFTLLVPELNLNDLRLTRHDVARLAVHLKLVDTAAQCLVILSHVVVTTTSFFVSRRIWHSLRGVFWRLD